MDSTRGLIDILRARQKAIRDNNREFAARLGITPQLWWVWRTGGSAPGRRALGGILRAFPDLEAEVKAALFLPCVSENMDSQSMNGEAEAVEVPA